MGQSARVSFMEVTIIIPCLNEAETIGECISEAQRWAAQDKVALEIIVADNGSSDGSCEIAERLGARVVHVRNRGYGSAVRGGVSEASNELIIMGDGDLSYDFSDAEQLLSELMRGAEVCVGNRFRGNIEPGAMPFLNRYLGNPFLSFCARKLFGIPIGDFHCGIRAFTRSAYDVISPKANGMEFASELIVKAGLRGLRITEAPVKLRKDGRSRPPHLKPFQDGFRHLALLLLLANRKLIFLPTFVVMALLLFVTSGLLLSPGPILLAGEASFGLGTLLLSTNLLIALVFVVVGHRLLQSKLIGRELGGVGMLDPWVERQMAGQFTWVGVSLLVLGGALFFAQSASWFAGGFVLPSTYSDLKLFIVVSSLTVAGFFFITMAMLALALEVFEIQPVENWKQI